MARRIQSDLFADMEPLQAMGSDPQGLTPSKGYSPKYLSAIWMPSSYIFWKLAAN